MLAWNPDVCPKYAMADYDNAEIASLEEVFPDIQVFFMWFSSWAVLAQVTGAAIVVSHTSSYLIWFDNLPKNFSKFIITSAINLQKVELNKGLYLSKIFPNDHNVITKNAIWSEILRELTLAIFYSDRFSGLFWGFSRCWYLKIFLDILISHISPWADSFLWLHSGNKR